MIVLFGVQIPSFVVFLAPGFLGGQQLGHRVFSETKVVDERIEYYGTWKKMLIRTHLIWLIFLFCFAVLLFGGALLLHYIIDGVLTAETFGAIKGFTSMLFTVTWIGFSIGGIMGMRAYNRKKKEGQDSSMKTKSKKPPAKQGKKKKRK
jgi:hypothetical protein